MEMGWRDTHGSIIGVEEIGQSYNSITTPSGSSTKRLSHFFNKDRSDDEVIQNKTLPNIVTWNWRYNYQIIITCGDSKC